MDPVRFSTDEVGPDNLGLEDTGKLSVSDVGKLRLVDFSGSSDVDAGGEDSPPGMIRPSWMMLRGDKREFF